MNNTWINIDNKIVKTLEGMKDIDQEDDRRRNFFFTPDQSDQERDDDEDVCTDPCAGVR